jgi:type IV secretory pathway TrbD component
MSHVETPQPAVNSGAITIDHVHRSLKSTSILNIEVDMLGEAGRNSSFLSAISAALISFALSIWTNAAFQDPLPDAGWYLTYIVAPFLVVLGTPLGLWAMYEGYRANKLIKELKKRLGD